VPQCGCGSHVNDCLACPGLCRVSKPMAVSKSRYLFQCRCGSGAEAPCEERASVQEQGGPLAEVATVVGGELGRKPNGETTWPLSCS
jgi:hypothetical protein